MRTAVRALLATVVLVVLTGVIYPVVMTGIAQVAFRSDADGSLVQHDGATVGSSRIGQTWTGKQWFYGRPSAIDDDASTSSGTNLGPTGGVVGGMSKTAMQPRGAAFGPDQKIRDDSSPRSFPYFLVSKSRSFFELNSVELFKKEDDRFSCTKPD